MRILQSLYDAGGGVPPQLAITQLLVDRGHEVMVLAHEISSDGGIAVGNLDLVGLE